MTTNHDNELDFVLRHYREGALDTEKALEKTMMKVGDDATVGDFKSPTASPARRRSLRRWVAVAASLLCLVAFATIYWGLPGPLQPPSKGDDTFRQASFPPSGGTEGGRGELSFHFDDTPLPQVLDELGTYYGVTLTANDTTPRLTGDFAGDDLDDILLMVEEVLDVEVTKER